MSETQSLYYSRGVTPNQVYTDSSLLSELNANVQGISLPIAISDEDVQVGENYYYALKAYPTTDLTGDGYTVKDSNSGLPLYVGYFAEGDDKIVTIDENGTLTELDTELINTQSGTVSIAPTPSTATVVINGEVRSSITAAVGTTVSYTVFKDGYVTVEDTATIASGTNLIPVELEEASSGGVALSVNYHPSSATVAINGTAGNIAVVPTNSPTTITASATGYDTFEPIVKTYTASTVENIYLYKHASYENDQGYLVLPQEADDIFKQYFTGLNWKFEASLPLPASPLETLQARITLGLGPFYGMNSLIGIYVTQEAASLVGLGSIRYLELESEYTDHAYWVEYPTKIEITPTSVEEIDYYDETAKVANVHMKLTITNIHSGATRIVEADSTGYTSDTAVIYTVYQSGNYDYSKWNVDSTLYYAKANIEDSSTSTDNTGSAIIYYSEE